jgi:hypothetical protein
MPARVPRELPVNDVSTVYAPSSGLPVVHTFFLNPFSSYWRSRILAGEGVANELLDELGIIRVLPILHCLISIAVAIVFALLSVMVLDGLFLFLLRNL